MCCSNIGGLLANALTSGGEVGQWILLLLAVLAVLAVLTVLAVAKHLFH